MKKKIEPGEWKTDKFGQRYREIGPGMNEYEPTTMTTAGEIPESQLDEFNARRKAAREMEQIAVCAELEELANRRRCPFVETFRHCDPNCAFRLNGACSIAVIAERIPPLPPEEMTSGKNSCPITHFRCSPDCALCVHGACAIKKIAKGSMKNE